MEDSVPSPAAPEVAATAPHSAHANAHELVAVILLSLVAVLTAWCGFQSAKWGGDSAVAFSEASSARIEATDFDGQARDARSADLAVYSQWVLASFDDDPALAAYIQDRFSPEFALAFDAWDADGRTERGPFVMPEYVPDGTVEAAAAKKKADGLQATALDFNDKGDNYSLMTVLFALVLFLAAIAQRGISLLASRLVLGLGGVIAAAGLVLLLTFPVRF